MITLYDKTENYLFSNDITDEYIITGEITIKDSFITTVNAILIKSNIPVANITSYHSLDNEPDIIITNNTGTDETEILTMYNKTLVDIKNKIKI